jgi:transposase
VGEVSTIGLDLAKSVFQAHGADASGGVVLRKKLRRDQVLAFFAGQRRCLVAMEACASGHYWAREIQAPRARQSGMDPVRELHTGQRPSERPHHKGRTHGST